MADDQDLSAMTIEQLRTELERIDAEMAEPPIAATPIADIWRRLHGLALRAAQIQVEITRRYADQVTEMCSMRVVETATQMYDGETWRTVYVMIQRDDRG